MSTLAVQQRDERVRAIRAAGTVNGIETLEVASVDQRTLRVVFVHPLPDEAGAVPPGPAPALTAEQIAIEGGTRIQGIQVESVAAAGNELTVTADRAGDFSTYVLRVVASPLSETPPDGFDPVLAAIPFSFKVGCPSDFDCRPETGGAPRTVTEPPIDYLAKDFRGLRRMMLERMGALMPDWRERNPADQTVMLVELLAYTADQLSYFQDAVAAEPYLETARRRPSLRRLARMLDYRMHDGCNARAWIHLGVAEGGDADGAVLPARTPFLTASAGDAPVQTPAEAGALLDGGDPRVVAFESLHGQRLSSAHNEIELYTWSGSIPCLPAGATGATLRSDPPLELAPGDALLLEETRSPATGSAADADPGKRWVVRLTAVAPATDPLDGTPLVTVAWRSEDALPFQLCLAAELAAEGGPETVATSRARGNLVLADHGRALDEPPGLDPAVVPDDGRPYRPRLARPGITVAEPYVHAEAVLLPASRITAQDPRAALPWVRLSDGERDWVPRIDLLGSDRFSTGFVAEGEHDGSVHLRFGDGVHGLRPSAGDAFEAVYRIGSGPVGNVGAGSLRCVVSDLQDFLLVRNPLPATGGVLPEGAAEVRRSAPQAFRVQERAVTAEDWAAVAQRHPEVQKARARFRWTGSWHTVFLTLDRVGGRPVLDDPEFTEEMLAFLDRFRVAGYDLELREPIFVPLDVQLRVCLAPGHFAADVRGELRSAFSTGELADGRRGFFHPDRFTFGKPLYTSELYARAMAVEGVASVEALRLQRWGQPPAGEREAGVVAPAENEILRCDSDPNLAENGLFEAVVLGERT